MAGGYRGRVGLLGRMGASVAPVTAPVVEAGIISPLTGQSTFWFSTPLLGQITFPYAPPKWDTLNKRKVTDKKTTWNAVQIKEWPIVSGANGLLGVERTLQWQILSGAHFAILRSFFESNQQVTWNPGARARVAGEKYFVTLTKLTPGEDHRLFDYVNDVQLTLNIRGIA